MEFDNPLLRLSFDKVCMYHYDPSSAPGDQDNQLIVNNDGQLTISGRINRTVQLDGKIAEELSRRLGAPESYGEDVMRCFIPHLAFVYFLKNEIVFHVSICLQCNNLRPSMELPAEKAGRGLSKSFRQFLNNMY